MANPMLYNWLLADCIITNARRMASSSDPSSVIVNAVVASCRMQANSFAETRREAERDEEDFRRSRTPEGRAERATFDKAMEAIGEKSAPVDPVADAALAKSHSVPFSSHPPFSGDSDIEAAVRTEALRYVEEARSLHCDDRRPEKEANQWPPKPEIEELK